MMAEPPNSTEDKETELTMCDVLEEEKELEDDANAVLGGSDDKNCSYDEGYVPRQALYACMSCSVNGEAGVCLACCYACHDGHEVVELYTKRDFRCDCGNGKFPDMKCSLNPNKEPSNSKNKYNQNFKGLYCSCNRPYPDLEDNTPDEMIQCIFCEDWYHGRHLRVKVPDDYFEMICHKCMESHPFLYAYLNHYDRPVDVVGDHVSTNKVKSETVGDSKQETPNSITVEQNNGITDQESGDAPLVKKECVDNVKEGIKSETDSDFKQATPNSKTVQQNNGIPDHGSVATPVIKKERGDSIKDENVCLLKEYTDLEGRKQGAAFWPENWRKELCRCLECMVLYAEAHCEFLMDPDDTIQAYEERGKSKGNESQYDKGLSALSQMDRVKQMEAVRAYTSMKGQLKEYLKEFADNKRTVRECDIKEFFERIGKKQKLNNGVPHFCR